jgi:hypothetical protein
MFAKNYNQAVKQIAEYTVENLSSEAQRQLHFAQRHKKAPVYFDDDGVPCALHEPKAQAFDYASAIARIAEEVESLASAYENLVFDKESGAIIELDDCQEKVSFYETLEGGIKGCSIANNSQKRIFLADICKNAFGVVASDVVRLLRPKKRQGGTF